MKPAPWKISFCALFAFSALVRPLPAAEPGPAMTRVEIRTISDKIAPGSFGSKPKVIYIAGDKYTRMEEAADIPHGVQQLIVASEPDIWMINLLNHTGRHILDEDPNPVVHQKIFGPSAPKVFETLEFGKEVAFFHDHQAAPLAARTVDDQRCEALEIKQEGYRVVLLVGGETHQPVQLEIEKPTETYAIRYVKYETGLPFDAALYHPPAKTKIVEAKPAPKK